MLLHQRETLSVVESAVNVEHLDFEVGASDELKKLRGDAAGGDAVGETAHRQRVVCVANRRYSIAYLWKIVVPSLAPL